MATDASTSRADRGFANILRNLAWLVGGKGFGALCSLVYLAVLSRSLGLKDFGHFSLIFGTGQALVAIASFQTWQTIVKFGADPVHRGEWAKFGRLAWLCGSIDVAGATLGSVVAAIIYYGFGDALGLNPRFIDMAFAFNCALLWSRLTTPNGIVRVLDRFDLGTYVEAVVPIGRLLASFAIVLTGASVGRFLFAWAFFDLLAAALYWFVAWRIIPEALHRGNLVRPQDSLAENPGLGKFFGITYLSSTLDAIYKQGPLLAVGYFLGTSAAGLYRLADQLAQGIGKLSSLMTRAVFPEFALARIGSAADDFRKLVRKVTMLAGAAGLLILAVAYFAGEAVLLAIGGPAFVGGAAILMPLALGAAFELAAVAYEPLLYSTGHAPYPLAVRGLAVVILGISIVTLVPLGPLGIGYAVAIGLAVAYFLMSVAAFIVLRSSTRHEAR